MRKRLPKLHSSAAFQEEGGFSTVIQIGSQTADHRVCQPSRYQKCLSACASKGSSNLSTPQSTHIYIYICIHVYVYIYIYIYFIHSDLIQQCRAQSLQVNSRPGSASTGPKNAPNKSSRRTQKSIGTRLRRHQLPAGKKSATATTQEELKKAQPTSSYGLYQAHGGNCRCLVKKTRS